jgi:hypothetical protein
MLLREQWPLVFRVSLGGSQAIAINISTIQQTTIQQFTIFAAK